MKMIRKIIVALSALLVISCDATDLDLQVNPNAVAADQAGVQYLYNSVMGGFIGSWSNANFNAMSLARMTALTSGNKYTEAISTSALNDVWTNAYAGLFPDVDALVQLADERGLAIHKASANIVKAFTMLVLVDMIGDVPYSEVGQGINLIAPKDDEGASVYAAAEELLNASIAELTDTEAVEPDFDVFYNGDPEKWIRLANTLKMKIYLQTRLVDANAASKFMAIVNGGDFIDGPEYDFQFKYGTERSNPNSRHPFYNDSYESSDGTYQSNYYMWLLYSEKRDANGVSYPSDPRIRFYFYRQDLDLRNESNTVWGCVETSTPFSNAAAGVLQTPPAHYTAIDPKMPYCIVSIDGYFGRDHGNNSGIPPDGPVRTVYGLYPGGGRFDDDQAEFTQNSGTDGALGAGIEPIMLSGFVDFMRAEMALTAGTGENAKDLMLQGAEASIDKVYSFRSMVDLTQKVAEDLDGNILTLADSYLDETTLEDNKDEYLANLNAIYDNASDKLDVVMKEYLIALFGNGYEAYNNLRRTGKPNNIAPMLEANAGTFAYSFFYPTNHVNFNPNATQKSGFTHVFWDTHQDNFVR